ncbi:MAG TPA: hypothetical protein VH561_20295 [Micromonosporaceae bacterium]
MLTGRSRRGLTTIAPALAMLLGLGAAAACHGESPGAIHTTDGATATPTQPAAHLDPKLGPAHGTLKLSTGFSGEPKHYKADAGGPVDTSYLPGCSGYASSEPDLRLIWSGTGGRLRLFFVPGKDGADPGLAIEGPGEQWQCDNDTYGKDPAVDYPSAPSGEYDIWVTNDKPGPAVDGSLYLTELVYMTPDGL